MQRWRGLGRAAIASAVLWAAAGGVAAACRDTSSECVLLEVRFERDLKYERDPAVLRPLLASVPQKCANVRDTISSRLQLPTAYRPPPPRAYEIVARGPSLLNAVFSGDGRRVFGINQPASIVALASTDLSELKRIQAPGPLTRLLSSQDGARLYAIGFETLFAFDVDTGAELWRRNTRDTGQPAKDIALSPDGALLATMEDNRVFRTWDAATGRMTGEYPSVDRAVNPRPFGHGHAVFSTDGKTLMYAARDGVRGIALDTGEDRIILGSYSAWSFQWFMPIADGIVTRESNGLRDACVLRKHDATGGARVLATRFYWNSDNAGPPTVAQASNVVIGRTLTTDHQWQTTLVDLRTGARGTPVVAGVSAGAQHTFSADGRFVLVGTGRETILARRPQ